MSSENVASIIKFNRIKNKINQKNMAEFIGVSPRHYQRLESTGKFNMKHLELIFDKLSLCMIIVSKNDSAAKMLKVAM